MGNKSKVIFKQCSESHDSVGNVKTNIFSFKFAIFLSDATFSLEIISQTNLLHLRLPKCKLKGVKQIVFRCPSNPLLSDFFFRKKAVKKVITLGDYKEFSIFSLNNNLLKFN